MFGLPDSFEDARRRAVQQAAEAKMAALRRQAAQLRQTAGRTDQGIAHAGQQALTDYGQALSQQAEGQRLAARAAADAVPPVEDIIHGASAARQAVGQRVAPVRQAVVRAGRDASQAARDFVLGPAAPNTSGHGNPTNYYQLGMQYITGQGPRRQVFGQNDPATQILRQDANMGRLRDAIAGGAYRDGRERGWPNQIGGWRNVPINAKDYMAVPTAGRVGNLADAYLGSYGARFKVREVDPAGVATVDMHVFNDSDLKSLTHAPELGYSKWWQRNVEPHIIAKSPKRGPFSRTQQDFYYTDTIPLRPPPAAAGGGARPAGRVRP